MVGSIIARLFGGEAPPLAEKYLDISQQITAILDAGAFPKSPEHLRKINSLQWNLSDLILCPAEEFLLFFTPQKVDETYQLLQQAANYLRGSGYEELALTRPDDFVRRVCRKKRADETYQALLQEAHEP